MYSSLVKDSDPKWKESRELLGTYGGEEKSQSRKLKTCRVQTNRAFCGAGINHSTIHHTMNGIVSE